MIYRGKSHIEKKAEILVLILFSILYVVVTYFHEPWFDEAQAWQIAKCASLKELIFEIPHYEGHPALWSLILAIPAKLGIPFEIGLKAVGMLFSIVSIWLILFKMPYPRIMRLIIPFTYFIFYQYGIIVRPYVMMMLALLLLALCFPQRFNHPWKYIGILVFLCLTSAYGIVLAGGIAICMVYELIIEKGIKSLISGLFINQETLALTVLLLTAILIILEILPRNNTWVTSAVKTNSFIICFCCVLLTFMGECTLTTSSWFSKDRVLLQNCSINRVELTVFCIVGVFLWILVISASSKKILKYYVVPYILLAVFASYVYFSVHHVGVIFLLLLFWLGVLFQDDHRFEIGRLWINKIVKTEKDVLLIKRAGVASCMACLIVPLFWDVSAIMNDVKLEFSYGRKGSDYIQFNNLDNGLILSGWGESGVEIIGHDSGLYRNVYEVGSPVLLNAYFDHNICYNLNGGKDNEAYLHYKIPTDNEIQAALLEWRSVGIPEVLLGKPDLDLLYKGDISLSDYTLATILQVHYIWKNSITGGYIPLYVRNDLLSTHNIEPNVDEGIKYLIEGLPITEDMKEQVREGVTVEEILKPYLDAIFGEEK